MAILTRRSLLRTSLGVAAAGTLVRPYIANAQAKTAQVWWTQGFIKSEDEAFRKVRRRGTAPTDSVTPKDATPIHPTPAPVVALP